MRILFSILIFIVFVQSGFAACKYRIDIDNVTFPWTAGDSLVTATFTVTNRKPNTAGCENIVAGFSKGASSNYNRYLTKLTETMPYNIYKNAAATRRLKDLSDGGNAAKIFKTIPSPANELTITYYPKLEFPSGNVIRGTYKDIVALNIADQATPTVVRKSSNVRYLVYVPSVVNISLVDSGNPYDIGDASQSMNFGSLQTGEMLGFDAIVVASGSYAVYLSSFNDGRFKHSTVNSFVDYSVSVSGNPVSLTGSSSTPVSVYTGIETQSSGDVIPISVTVGDLTNKVGGSYSDYITISAVATD